MCELTQPNPDYPDETQLTETPETLYAISDLFERIEQRANQMFNALEALERSTTKMSYRTNYGYDDFRIVDGMVQLNGSYYSRCDGNETTEYHVNFKDFFDPEYLDRKKAEAVAHTAAAEAKKLREEENRKAQQEAAEREQYARLQAKFGG